MKTITKNSKSKTVNFSVPIFVNYLVSGQVIRSCPFFTESEYLLQVLEFCQDKDQDFKDDVFTLLIDEDEYFSILFSEKLKRNPFLLSDPELRELFDDYWNAIQHYLGCFSQVLEFMKRLKSQNVSFTLNIDVTDPGSPEITLDLLDEDSNINFQLK